MEVLPWNLMKNGEHWFRTTEQMAFLDDWIRGLLK